MPGRLCSQGVSTEVPEDTRLGPTESRAALADAGVPSRYRPVGSAIWKEVDPVAGRRVRRSAGPSISSATGRAIWFATRKSTVTSRILGAWPSWAFAFWLMFGGR